MGELEYMRRETPLNQLVSEDSIMSTEGFDDMAGANTLVTGGAGFIGSHIVDELMELGARVLVLDDMSNGNVLNIAKWKSNKRFKFIKGDVRDCRKIRKHIQGVEFLFHQAAKVSVPFSVKEPHLVLDVNVLGTTNILEESRRADVDKVVMASSSSVYGDTTKLPKAESMCPEPVSPYGVSKLAQEEIGKSFHRIHDMNVTSLRYFNVYGPRQRGGSYAGVISIYFAKALKNNPLPIFGDGTITRDFTYVRDVVQANLLAASNKASKGRIYNVAKGKKTSLNELADAIIKLTSSESDVQYLDPRPGDIHDSLADLTIIDKEIGYHAKYDIIDGLRETLDWIRMRRD